VSPRLPSKIKSVNSHQIDEVASRIIAKKAITIGRRNRVIISIERELNIRNPLEAPAAESMPVYKHSSRHGRIPVFVHLIECREGVRLTIDDYFVSPILYLETKQRHSGDAEP
jgi:hypothetical protein